MPRQLLVAMLLVAIPTSAPAQSPPSALPAPGHGDGHGDAATGASGGVPGEAAGAGTVAKEPSGSPRLAEDDPRGDESRRRSRQGGVRVASAGRDIGIARQARAREVNEFTTQLGLQASLGGSTPAGLKLFFDYAHRLGYLVWLDFQVNTMFGVGHIRGTCYDRFGDAFDCGGAVEANGHAIDALAGVKLRFPVERAPIVPYLGFNGGVVAVYDRPAGDNGVAVVARVGGGLRYFPTRYVGIGGEVDLTLGPAFYSDTCTDCNNSHVALYRAFEASTGVEFLF